MNQNKKYSSKVLLFGEYTILHGSKALAMPFEKYAGSWTYEKGHSSQIEIHKLKNYLLKIYREGKLEGFDFDELEYQLSKHLAFESNIPQGYGLGSSGSVSAAVYDAFCKKDELVSITDLKNTLANIESCYHGSSSGTDPLVSYLGQPILMHSKEKIELLDGVNESINKNLYLIDTGIKRSTAPLVASYLEMRRESEAFLSDMQAIAEINDQIIDAYLADDKEKFDRQIRNLSKAQFQTLKMLIPKDLHELWAEGLESGEYSMKLNGAGGGGFLMVYCHRRELSNSFSDFDLIKLH